MTTLFPLIIASEALKHTVLHLQQVVATLYRTDVSPAEHLAAVLTPEELEFVSTRLGGELANIAQIEEILSQSIQELLARPILTVQLAFAPSQSFINETIDWLLNHSAINCQVAFNFEPSVIGGAIITWEGKQYDYCLATKIDRYEKFPKIS